VDSFEAVDVHTHVVPIDLVPPSDDERWPIAVEHGDVAELRTSTGRRRVIPATAWNLDRRLLDMENHGVSTQVLSPLPELFAYWAEPGEAAEWCRGVNDWTAKAMATHPDSFDGLGILPMQDPEAAARVLDEVADGPLCGIALGTNVAGVPLTDPRFAEIFRLAAALDLCVFVHAVPGVHTAAVARRLGDPALAVAATFPGEIASVGLGLLAANRDVRSCPRIALSHCGGGMPLLTGRLAGMRGEATDTQRFWYDSLAHDDDLLDAVAHRGGAARILAGSDYPSALPDWPDQVARASAVNAAAFLGSRSRLHRRLHVKRHSGTA